MRVPWRRPTLGMAGTTTDGTTQRRIDHHGVQTRILAGSSQPPRRAVDTPEARRRDCRMTSPAFGRFFLPGPTDVHPDVLAAMQRPMIGHRSSAMEQILSGMAPQLGKLFRTTHPVMVGTASATGFMEMAVRNGIAR